MEEVTAVSAAEQAAMDRRRKLEHWKAQKEAEKAAKGQVRSSRARPRAALSAAGLVRPLHPARGVLCSARMLLDISRHASVQRAAGQKLCLVARVHGEAVLACIRPRALPH